MNNILPTARRATTKRSWSFIAARRAVLVSFALFAGAVTGAGCADAIDRITDCQDICERYADCFDSTYDVGKCRDNCDDRASNSASFDQTVDNCENCLDDRSCASATFTCTTECATIVP